MTKNEGRRAKLTATSPPKLFEFFEASPRPRLSALKLDTDVLSSNTTLDLLKEFSPPAEEGGEEGTDSIPDEIRKESGRPLVMSPLAGSISYVLTPEALGPVASNAGRLRLFAFQLSSTPLLDELDRNLIELKGWLKTSRSAIKPSRFGMTLSAELDCFRNRARRSLPSRQPPSSAMFPSDYTKIPKEVASSSSHEDKLDQEGWLFEFHSMKMVDLTMRLESRGSEEVDVGSCRFVWDSSGLVIRLSLRRSSISSFPPIRQSVFVTIVPPPSPSSPCPEAAP
jgi:hypothetical protein